MLGSTTPGACVCDLEWSSCNSQQSKNKIFSWAVEVEFSLPESKWGWKKFCNNSEEAHVASQSKNSKLRQARRPMQELLHVDNQDPSMAGRHLCFQLCAWKKFAQRSDVSRPHLRFLQGEEKYCCGAGRFQRSGKKLEWRRTRPCC